MGEVQNTEGIIRDPRHENEETQTITVPEHLIKPASQEILELSQALAERTREARKEHGFVTGAVVNPDFSVASIDQSPIKVGTKQSVPLYQAYAQLTKSVPADKCAILLARLHTHPVNANQISDADNSIWHGLPQSRALVLGDQTYEVQGARPVNLIAIPYRETGASRLIMIAQIAEEVDFAILSRESNNPLRKLMDSAYDPSDQGIAADLMRASGFQVTSYQLPFEQNNAKIALAKAMPRSFRLTPFKTPTTGPNLDFLPKSKT